MQTYAALCTLTAVSGFYGFDCPCRPDVLSFHPLFGSSRPVRATTKADCDQRAADVFAELSIVEYAFSVVFCITRSAPAFMRL